MRYGFFTVLLPVLAAIVVLIAYQSWKSEMTSSATVRLTPAGYDLTYTVEWGWGMDEKFSLAREGEWLAGPSSGWMEIWKRPYNSGLALYRAADDGTYYLGLGYKFFTFEPSTGVLKSDCNAEALPTRTPLGLRLLDLNLNRTEREAADPGAQDRFGYVEPDQGGPLPSAPPVSKYYTNLVYLGKFGLTRAKGRGGPAEFVPANKGAEIRLGLEPFCG
ncbi:hypothetical protein EOA30_16145 [Mesorhizobium sp. M8A.F.Ca.ET.059.01.1.1]|nr:hypothetical protein EOA30_16145 [Mesorhizobium sp. M8A.F.Ca.ET.059.01.1.1]